MSRKTVCHRHEVAHEMGSGCPYCEPDPKAASFRGVTFERPNPIRSVTLSGDRLDVVAGQIFAAQGLHVHIGHAVDSDSEHVAVGSKAYLVADGSRFQPGDPVYIGSDGKAHVAATPVMQACACGHRFEHDGRCEYYACPSCDKTMKRQAGGGWA